MTERSSCRHVSAPSPSHFVGPSLSREGRGDTEQQWPYAPLPSREREGPGAKRWEGEGALENTAHNQCSGIQKGWEANSMKTKVLAMASAVVMAAGAAQAADQIRVGMITTLSGGGSGLGIDIRDGFMLGLEHVGGRFGGLDTVVTEGNVFTTDPDHATVKKMLDIARGLSATIQGDGGEFYDSANQWSRSRSEARQHPGESS